jgi:hypothetical protein
MCLGEAHHVQPSVDETRRHEANLVVVVAIIDLEQRRLEVEVGRTLERQVAEACIAITLVCVEADPHAAECTYKKTSVRKARRDAAGVTASLLTWAGAFAVADSSCVAMQSALDLCRDHLWQVWDALIRAVAASLADLLERNVLEQAPRSLKAPPAASP